MTEELPYISISPEAKIVDIKKNVSIISQDGQKYILKKKRNGSKHLLDRFSYRNEIRIYRSLHAKKLYSLNIPDSFIEKESGDLILSFINADKEKELDLNDFSLSYYELQRISSKRQLVLDLYVKIFLSFFYRVFLVSLFTISRKVSLKTAIRSILLFLKLNFMQKRMAYRYWIHGDFYADHFFYNENGKLFFIDFENMFWTRKWPLAEIIGKSFHFEAGKVIFSPGVVGTYLENLPRDSEIRTLDTERQFRFALLQHAVREIAHTKGNLKKEEYVRILQTVLDKKNFRTWYSHYYPTPETSGR